MNCSRRLYRGNAYEICLPLVYTGVTLVRIYTRGDVIIEKEPEITGDSMCFSLSVEDLASLEDGVLRYQVVTEYETIDTNSPYVVVTPGDYSGRTIDDIIQDAYDSGYTDGYEVGYDSGYTDGFAACESGETVYATSLTINVDDSITGSGIATVSYSPANAVVDIRYTTSIGHGGATIDPETGEIKVKLSNYVLFQATDLNSRLHASKYAYCLTEVPKVLVSYNVNTNQEPVRILGDSGLTAFSKMETLEGVEIPLSETYQFQTTGQNYFYLTLADPHGGIPDYAFGCAYVGTPHSRGSVVSTVQCGLEIGLVGNHAFEGCGEFLSISFNGYVSTYGEAAFMSCLKMNFAYPPSYVGYLGDSCYKDCRNLTTVMLPSGNTVLNPYLLWGTQISNLVIPEGVTIIGQYAIGNCPMLTNVTIPSSVTAILDSAFRGDTRLFSVTIPSGITKLYDNVFEGCDFLGQIIMEPTVPPTGYNDEPSPNAFGRTSYTFPIYVPYESVHAYKEAFPAYANRFRCVNNEPYNQQYLTLEAIEDGYIRLASMDNNPKGLIHVRKNYGEWEDYDQWTALQFDCVSGDTFEFRAAMNSYWAVNFSSSTAKFNAYGNIWSLVFDNALPENDSFWLSIDYLFSNLFLSSRLVDASNLWLGGQNTFIPPHGFEYTFASCTYLVAAPELPMMNLGEYAYNCMFYGCTSLETAPELPYHNPPTGAYERMFYRCGNLQYIKCDARNTGMTDEWVREVAGYGIFIQAPGVEWSTGWSGIPSGWDRFDYLFESDVKSITAHPEATSVTITIKSVYSWTRTSQPDWARTNKVSGQQGETTVRVDIESATSPRFGDIVFTDEKGNTIKISVTQAEMPIIWVDDFPDGTSEEWGYAEPYDPEFCQEFYEHESFDAYLDDYLADKQDNGCNKYKIYGEMNFEDEEYYVYRMVNPDTGDWHTDGQSVEYGLIPKDTDLEEYRSKSMASDHTAFYPAFAHYLSGDEEEYDMSDREYPYVLVDTE